MTVSLQISWSCLLGFAKFLYLMFNTDLEWLNIWCLFIFCGLFSLNGYQLTAIYVKLFSVNRFLKPVRIEAKVTENGDRLKNPLILTFTSSTIVFCWQKFLKIVGSFWENNYFMPGQYIRRTLYIGKNSKDIPYLISPSDFYRHLIIA